jgi:hypothetical protein
MATVAVLGCGPAGLFAAQALSLHGFNPVILSKKQKSVIYGAQYLHKPIPGLSSQRADGVIRTIRAGREDIYAHRVYGAGQAVTSWRSVRPLADAWDLRSTYDRAWNKFQESIADIALAPDDIAELTSEFDLVISTVPLWSICLKPKEHSHDSLSILVKKDLEELIVVQDENWVLYNGTHDHDWYRASQIFGHTSAEARANPTLVASQHGWEIGFKVIGNNCDCHPNVVRAGRMGLWTRAVLTHHAFEKACEAIADQFGVVTPGAWTGPGAGSDKIL